jgi:hypothetical protein
LGKLKTELCLGIVKLPLRNRRIKIRDITEFRHAGARLSFLTASTDSISEGMNVNHD